MAEEVVLVDEMDREAGVASKLAAHEDGGRLHRAFSVFVFDSAGRVLLQRRAEEKYHFGGLWSNACCGHPRPGEDVREAASRRLWEEMGISPELEPATSFVYEAFDPASGLTEREYDHVFFGRYDGEPVPDPGEAEGWAWSDPEELAADLAERPGGYTPWFPIAAERLCLDFEKIG